MVSLRQLLTAAAATLPLANALAPLVGLDAADLIADSFIVVLKNDVSDEGLTSHLAWADGILGSNNAERGNTYNVAGFRGYSVNIAQSIVQLLADSDDIAFIEANQKVTTQALVTQSDAPYGLARISHRELGSTDYIYDDSAGSGTYAYIIDTGIRTTHEAFGGRATFGANFAGDGIDTDGNGHGTHVAGTTGSGPYGVAKKTNLIAVKVLDASGSGSNDGVLAGIDWAIKDAQAKGHIRRSVANLSLGGLLSSATNQAVAAAVKAGMFVAVAAGNSMSLAELSSPSSEPTVCTVAASDDQDARASYSNFGGVVDVFAPGSDVLSAWIDSDTDTNIISGTSMASPHIAGLAAYLIGLEGESEPQALCERIRDLGTKDTLSGTFSLLGTPNILAYNGNGA